MLPTTIDNLDVVETLALLWLTELGKRLPSRVICRACNRKLATWDELDCCCRPNVFREGLNQVLNRHMKESPQCVVFRMKKR